MSDLDLAARVRHLEEENARLRDALHMEAAQERAARFYDDPDSALEYEDYMEADREGRIASERYHAHREEW
jgi:hypothetical protein